MASFASTAAASVGHNVTVAPGWQRETHAKQGPGQGGAPLIQRARGHKQRAAASQLR